MSEFLAEATVLIRPEMTSFRATLEAELLAATKGLAINIPVVAGAGTAGITAAAAATTVAANESAAALEKQGAAAARTTVSTERLTVAQRASINASHALAVAQSEVANAASAVAAAQVTATRSTAAVAVAQRAVDLAIAEGNAELIIATQKTLGLAESQAAEASSALAAARAQAVHAASLGQVSKAGIASGASMLGLRGAVLTAGAAFLGATVAFQSFARAVGLSIDLNRSLNVFRITAGATADEMARVSEEAKALGRDITLPGVAAQDAAATMTELAKAGLDVEDAMAAARGTLQLATAAQIDNAAATELVANALNAFQLSGGEATKVADLLAGAANASQGSIVDMGLALKQVAAVANLVGLSVEETVALLTQLARAGLSASDAGTSLRTTLLRLTGDFPKVSAEVERLHLRLRDVDGSIRPQFFSDLGERLQKMAPAARQATVALLGGSDAIRAIGILSRTSEADLNRLLGTITQQGIAAEIASAQTQELGGDVEGTKNEFAALGTTLGGLVSGPLSLFVSSAGQAAGAVNDVVTELERADQGLGETFGDFINRFSESFARLNLSFQEGVRRGSEFTGVLDRMATSGNTADAAIQGLIDTLNALGKKTQATLPEQGLSGEQVLNRLSGFDAAEVRARITGSNDAILAVLREEQAFLEGQLNREFVKNRNELRRKLEAALLGVVNDINSIQSQAESATARSIADSKRRAEELARQRREADQALLEALGIRREDAENRITAAGAAGNVAAQLRAMDSFQALIQKQIQKVRQLIKDEKLRRDTIRLLRLALGQSRREEAALRAERVADAIAQREENIRLLIENAQITGNQAREVALQKKLVADLERQVRNSKLRGNKLQELKNELARERQRLKELQGSVATTKDAFKELTFEFLQAQQGFAANLFGNLVPMGATGGLVSKDFSGATFGDAVGQQSALTNAAQRGTTPTQTAQELDLLRQMLAELKAIRSGNSHPEARFQKRSSGGQMEMQ